MFPEADFEYSFLDEEYNNLYSADEKMGKLFFFFSLLIIFVACLGIFGLTSFLSEQRSREIGIRKVMGSSVMNIVRLLTADFTKWVLVANVLAIPIAWYAMDKWLQNYAYSINPGALPFVLAGAMIIVIALLTVGFQVVRAALADPVDSLRYE